jgi:signal transduction histidine kinase/ActR/RegA family two-component response regulator
MGKRSMSLRFRLAALIVAALGLLLLVGGVGAVGLKKTGESLEAIARKQVTRSLSITDTRDHLITAEYWAMQYVNEGQAAAKGRYLDLAVEIDANMEEIDRFEGAGEHEVAAAGHRAWRQASEAGQQAMKLPPGSSETEEVYPLEDFHGPISQAIGLMGDLNVESLVQMRRDAKSQTERSARLVLALAGASVLGIVFLGFKGRRLLLSVSKPLAGLEEATERFGADDLEHRVSVHANDELGRLGGAFNQMAERLQQSREQLLQSQKMEALGQLAGGVAHDFNNQLVIVKNYADFIEEVLPEESPAREDLEEIRRAATRASSLSDQLLTFARREVSQPKVLDVDTEIRDSQKLLARMLSARVKISVDLAASSSILIDPAQFQQVLLNLASNAKDAMPDGGTITLSTERVTLDGDDLLESSSGECVRIEIADTGHGMDEKTAQRIFEPFFTTKERGRGTGLGLATTYGTIKRAGGDISVRSSPGEGSTFTIHLPVCAASSEWQETEIASSAQQAASNKTILVAEDEAAVRALVDRVLRRHGYSVTTARSGEEALQIFAEAPASIDLVLSDVIMPGITGKELADRVREMRADIPVILMSGFVAQSAVTGEVLEREDLGFVAKPFSSDQILREVGRRLLETETDRTVRV